MSLRDDILVLLVQSRNWTQHGDLEDKLADDLMALVMDCLGVYGGIMQGLAIGRIVHVSCGKNKIRPAVVTSVADVEKGVISAHIFRDPKDAPGEPINESTGQSIGYELAHDAELSKPGTWRFPPRV